MDSIAVTKPDMAVLSQGRLPLSPFGSLAYAFAEGILARTELEEGRYPYVPLELLKEEEQAPMARGQTPVLQVDLRLILEALRKEPDRTEQAKATERIVERILRLQKERDTRTVERLEREPAKVLGAFRQNLVQVLNQDIRLYSVQGSEMREKGGKQSRYAAGPGQLGRQSIAFSQQLQTLEKEGKFFSGAGGERRDLPSEAASAGGDSLWPWEGAWYGDSSGSLESLTHLKEGGGSPEEVPAVSLPADLVRVAERAADQVLLLRRSQEERKASTRPAEPATGRPFPALAPVPSATDTKPGDPSSDLPPKREGGLKESNRTSVGGEWWAEASPYRTGGGQGTLVEPSAQMLAGPGLQDGLAKQSEKARVIPDTAGTKLLKEKGRISSADREIRVAAAKPLSSEALPPDKWEGDPDLSGTVPVPAEIVYRTEGEQEAGEAERARPGSASDGRTAEKDRDSGRKQGKPRPSHASDISQDGRRGQGFRETGEAAQGKAPPSPLMVQDGKRGGLGQAGVWRQRDSRARPPEPGQETGAIPQAELAQRPGEGGPSPQRIQGKIEATLNTPGTPPGISRRTESGGRELSSAVRNTQIGRQVRASSGAFVPQGGSQAGGIQGQRSPAELVYWRVPEGDPTLPDGVERTTFQRDFPALTGPAHGTDLRPARDLMPPEEERSRLFTVRDMRAGGHESITLRVPSPRPVAWMGGVSGQSFPMGPFYRGASEEGPSAAKAGTDVPPLSGALLHPTMPGEEVSRMEMAAWKTLWPMASAALAEGQTPPLTIRDMCVRHRQAEQRLSGTAAWKAKLGAEALSWPSELSYRGGAGGEGVPREMWAKPTRPLIGERDLADPGTHVAQGGQLPHPLESARSTLSLAHLEEMIPLQNGTAASGRSEMPEQGTGEGKRSRGKGRSFPMSGGAAKPGIGTRLEVLTGFFQRRPGSPLPAELVWRMEAGFRDGAAAALQREPRLPMNAEGRSFQAAQSSRSGRKSSAARDIRVGSGGSWSGMDSQAGESYEAVLAGWELENRREPAMAALASGPAPVELTYNQSQSPGESRKGQGTSGQPQAAVESDYVRSLPDWARRFLRESEGQSAAEREMGVAKSIASLPMQGETVQWTAPNYQPPRPPLAYREKKEEAPKREPELRVSDAELQRTADRVYRMIEERIRRERRRLGF